MKVNLITNNYNKIYSTFGQNKNTEKGSEKSQNEKRWKYSTYVYEKKIDYKNNPSEYEQDVFLGQKIEKLKSIIFKLEENMRNVKTNDEKEKLIKEISYYQQQKEQYINDLVSRHLPFALKMAHEYKFLNSSFEDLVSSANIGLMKAAEKYAPSIYPKVHFITYAKHWVKQQIYRDATKDKQIVMPAQVFFLYNKIKKAEYILREKLALNPTPEQISKTTGIDVDKVKSILRDASFKEISINDTYGEESEEASIESKIPDVNSQKLFEEKMIEEDLDFIKHIVNKYLSPKERFIITMRYRLDAKRATGTNLRTLDDISKEIGLTRERVRQIENTAIAKIRNVYEMELNGNH